MPLVAPPAPNPIPKWLAPWTVWVLKGKSYQRPLAPAKIPSWALWFPAWCQWRLTWGGLPGAAEHRPKSSPIKIPSWAWAELKKVADAMKPLPPPEPPPPPPPPPPPTPEDHEAELKFFRRMTVWVTRIDHMPVEWLVAYGNGQYPLVVVPTLFGKVMQGFPDSPPLTIGVLNDYVDKLHSHGFKVCGSQWGVGDDPVGEAEAALGILTEIRFDGWVMNGEKKYEGGFKSGAYTLRFRSSRPHFPFGWTPEQRLSLDHGVLQQKGVFYMPQYYPLESGSTELDYTIQWAKNFGYDLKNVGPLVQAYTTNGVRLDAAKVRDDCIRLGIGQCTLYPGNQCLDDPQFWRDLVIP